MLKAAIAVSPAYSKDALFDPSSIYNRDDCLAPWRSLKNAGECGGIEFHTLDVYQKNNSVPDVVIFSDLPWESAASVLGHWYSQVIKWALILENQIVLPHNWDAKRHAEFDRIFTWNDDVIDNRQYFKINYVCSFPSEVSFDIRQKRKLCTMISANKKSRHPLENYSKREEVIRWFEKHHPGDFDLYGFGWDQREVSGRVLGKILNKMPFLKKWMAPRYKTYRGSVSEKKKVFSKYRFAFCFENAKDMKGYVSEKIFDCFASGVVPVYFGTPNIQEYVPDECFVDLRQFDNYEKLYAFLINVNDDKYSAYALNINKFIKSEAALEFSAEKFVDTILQPLKQIPEKTP